jgi:hypothetical protein
MWRSVCGRVRQSDDLDQPIETAFRTDHTLLARIASTAQEHRLLGEDQTGFLASR